MDAEKFQRFLDVVEPERGGTVISAEPIPGGYSRETVLSEVRWKDGSTERFVLRGDPDDDRSVFRSDRAAEWRLLQALESVPTFTVATPRWYDATGEYMGARCIVSEAVTGTSMQALLDQGLDVDSARNQFVEIIASVHSTPLELVSDEIPRPENWNAHIDALMAIYDDILARQGECDPILRYVRRKVRANRPPEVPLGLVHGDYQPGNFLLSDDAPPVLIDWEFGHIGDPRTDLGYYTQIPMPPHLYTPDPESFLTRYRELTGYTVEQVNPDIVEYFKLIGLVSILSQMVYAADDIAEGEHRGVMGPYMLVAIAHFHNLFLTAAAALPNHSELS
jgi:aminoglycoside phosphotransferase (APT) family kinase protein